MMFLCFLSVLLVEFSFAQEVRLIESYNYTVETHHLETDDGYILEIYRIPYSQGIIKDEPNQYPVLVVHGWLGTSHNWLVAGPKRALAFKLADAGFDVWLLNCRGTKHSRKHKTLDPDDKTGRFWKFTWHEIGIYDIPNTIDYILNVTNSEKLHYIGHSQGNTAFFVMCSEKPEYNNKVKLLVSLAPPVYFEYLQEPVIKTLAMCCYKMIRNWLESQKIYEFPPFLSADKIRELGRQICGPGSFLPKTCYTFIEVFNLGISDQLDVNIISKIAEMGVGSSSIYQPCHFAQCMKTGRFMQYDWGPKENLRRYGSEVPRDYNLRNVTLPVALVYGKTDWITGEEDVIKLSKTLPNLVSLFKIRHEKWAHADFLWAKDADKHLNSYVLKMLRKFLD